MSAQRLQSLGKARMRVLRATQGRRADPGDVLDPHIQRVHADFLGAHVQHRLDREVGDRRARGAIRRGLRAVGHHVEADGAGVRDVIRGVGAQAAVHHRRARERARLELEDAVGGHDRAVLHHPKLHPHRRAGCWARGAEHFFPRHVQPHRQAAFLGQHRRDRFQIGHGLAAEAATDFRRGHPKVTQLRANDLRRQRTHGEMALAGGPDFALAVGFVLRDASVRLDISLVDGGGLEFLLDHDVGLGEAGRHVAHREIQALGDVGRLGRRRLHTAGDHVVEQQWRVRRHRFIDIDDMGQNFIFDLDQRRGVFGDAGTDRGHGGDGMAFIQDLLPRHDVARDVPEVNGDAFRPDVIELLDRQVLVGHDRLHARQCLGGGGVDRQNAGMRVR